MSESANYELLMPFVVCTSVGGPYDDEAFVAGWALAELDRDLKAAAESHLPLSRAVRPATMPQVDLIAMSHGYTARAEPWDDAPDEWLSVNFLRPQARGVS